MNSARTVAVYNQKGGSGKTTTAVNLAAALGEAGKQTLVIDLDPQASATMWLSQEVANDGLREVFLADQEILPLVKKTGVGGVYLVGSTIALSEVGFALRGCEQGTLRLKYRLQELPELWDYVLFDCPPAVGFLSLSALAAADEVLLPVEDSPVALKTVPMQEKIIQAVREGLNPNLEVSGFLLCRTHASAAKRKEAMERLKHLTPLPVFDLSIRENRSIMKAYDAGKPVLNYKSGSPGSRDYRRLASVFLRLQEQKEG